MFEVKKQRQFDEEAVEANIALNDRLEDGHVHASTEGLSEAESANIKLQEAFYDDSEKNDIAPTYMNNNTPAIKINPHD